MRENWSAFTGSQAELSSSTLNSSGANRGLPAGPCKYAINSALQGAAKALKRSDHLNPYRLLRNDCAFDRSERNLSFEISTMRANDSCFSTYSNMSRMRVSSKAHS